MKSFFTCCLWLLLGLRLSAQNLECNSLASLPDPSPANLIASFFGSGVVVTDVVFEGDPNALGSFSNGLNSLQIPTGIVMSTGHVASSGIAYGADANGLSFASSNVESPLFANLELSSLVPPTVFLNDIQRITITFKPLGDTLSFRYVFGSEEYPEYACSQYNDVFGFFISGPGYPTPTNVALIPGDGQPVSINNLHPANPLFPSCPSLNEQFYHDNNNASTPPVYDGFTSVFDIVVPVTPLETYTIQLSIADANDAVYDSGVFLENGSFKTNSNIAALFDLKQAVIPEDAIAKPATFLIQGVPESLLPLPYRIGGTAVNGVDYQAIASSGTIETPNALLSLTFQPIPDSLNEVLESVTVTFGDSSTFQRRFSLVIGDPPAPQSYEVCAATDSLSLTPRLIGLEDSTFLFVNNNPIALDTVNKIYFSNIDVTAPAYLNFLHVPAAIDRVCLNASHTWDEDLDLFLVSPEGKNLKLSADNGGSGNNYTNTCFSPAASQSITQGFSQAPSTAAPFTGVFQPEGDWQILSQSPSLGTWRLAAKDDAPGFVGTLLNWNLQLQGADSTKYDVLWNTGATSHTLLVNEPGLYVALLENDLCQVTRVFNVGLAPQVVDSVFATIQWGETYHLNGQSFDEPGEYALQLNNASGCDTLVVLNLQFASATQQPNSAARTVQVSPNPGRDRVEVTWAGTAAFGQLQIYSAYGALLQTHQLSPGSRSFALDFQQLPAGTYRLVLSGDTQTASVNLLVVHP